jgi:hypothetical protein
MKIIYFTRNPNGPKKWSSSIQTPTLPQERKSSAIKLSRCRSAVPNVTPVRPGSESGNISFWDANAVRSERTTLIVRHYPKQRPMAERMALRVGDKQKKLYCTQQSQDISGN